MNLNDLEFFEMFLFNNKYRIVDKKEDKIIDSQEKFRLNCEFLDLWEIKEKINDKYNEKYNSYCIHYVFKQLGYTVLKCFDNFIDDEFEDFLREEFGLIIVDGFFGDDDCYFYIECKKLGDD